MGDSAFRLDEDTRAQLTYPVIVKLGNEDPAPLNTYLHQQRLQWSLPAFSCMSRIYMGFGWQGQPSDTGTNGYEGNDTVSVLNLTPRLMSIEEGGSYFCGGAYPDNFITHRLVDARTGKPLVANSLLRGWVAKDADGKVVDPKTVEDPSTLTFGPSDDLVKYVISHRTKRDDQAEADCGIDDLIASNFGVYFTRDAMIFTLDDLPHVIFACGDDLVKVPLKDARPFLTDAAAKYFEALDP
jgi:hypothetical protein